MSTTPAVRPLAALVAGLVLAAAAALALATPPPAAADQAPPTLHLTNADDGRQLTIEPGTEVSVELLPARPGDVWQFADRGSDAHAVSEDEQRSVLTTKVNGSGSLSARTDAACRHAASPCDLPVQDWRVSFTLSPGPVPDNPPPAACTTPSATPTATTRVLTADDSGRGVTVHQGDLVVAEAGSCSEPDPPSAGFSDPFTPPTADPTGPLFRRALTGGSDLHQVQARFTTESTGRSTVGWATDVRCVPSQGQVYCFGRPSRGFRVQVTVVPAGQAIDPRADQCVQSMSAPSPFVLARSTVPLTGQADPGATVRVYFRRMGQTGDFTLRRTLLADSAGRFSTSFVPDAPYEFYAAAGTACRTDAQGVLLRPRISGPASVRRGSTVTLVVLGQPGSTVTVSFRRRGRTAFVLGRRARLGLDGYWSTSYRADDDYRYVTRDLTYGVDGNVGLTQVR